MYRFRRPFSVRSRPRSLQVVSKGYRKQQTPVCPHERQSSSIDVPVHTLQKRVLSDRLRVSGSENTPRPLHSYRTIR